MLLQTGMRVVQDWCELHAVCVMEGICRYKLGCTLPYVLNCKIGCQGTDIEPTWPIMSHNFRPNSIWAQLRFNNLNNDNITKQPYMYIHHAAFILRDVL